MEFIEMYSKFFAVYFAFTAVILVITIVSFWRIFAKAGKPGWAAIVPIYNTVVWLEIIGKPVWWILLLMIPGINIVFAIWITNLLSKSFGKDEAFTVGLILLPFVFYPILAFGKAQYAGPAGLEDLPPNIPSN